MKKIAVFLLCITVAFGNDVKDFKDVNNKFASTVYKEISNDEIGNFLVSPFSATTILALAHAGTRGQTAQELQQALHFPEDETKFQEGVKSVLSSLKGSDYTLHTANKMYIKNEFSIKQDFKKVAIEDFFSETENIDFVQNSQAAQVMNSWVEKQTKNKIQNLINPDILNNDTRLVLINALYLKADWSNPFYTAYTKKKDFHKSSSESVEVDAMHNYYGEYFLFYDCHHLNSKFLELPFKGGEASMTIILPNNKEGLAELERNLERALVPHNLTEERVELAIPKFKIESKIDLKTILKNLGVATIFKDFEADLSGIAGEKGGLVVNEVVQKSFIDVNEDGVEAAAATHLVAAVPAMLYPDPPKKFMADHPFVFYIKAKGVILFVGRVTDPSK